MKTPKFWQKKEWRSNVLLPVSWVYRALSLTDLTLKGLLAQSVSVPVISVGNVTAGGSGKTPIVMALAGYFHEKGEKVAILSRGYGAQDKTCRKIAPYEHACDAGDEPVMMATEMPYVDVWVSPNRIKSASHAIKEGATLILLDDGFQHKKLKRTIDLVCIKSLGNNRMLPAGPLREPLSALKRADAVIWTGTKTRKVSPRTFQIKSISTAPKTKTNKWVAFCALGAPDHFFRSLRKSGAKLVETVAFADHATYEEAEEIMLQELAEKKGADLITTAKDAVKLSKPFMKHCTIAGHELDPKGIQELGEFLSEELKNKKKSK
ncbi:MAG: tetraacyldisaccharide 4'-kinase [Pseudomonadota bacterium]|nr:tetraacyldisaccharide 4'-kinase [Pseudomonadota bacterium]